MNETLIRILELLEQCKKQQGSTQKDFAEYLGIKPSVISDWKNPKKGNSSYYDYIPQIADYFNVSTDYLLGKKQSKTPLPDKATAEEWRKILEDMEMTELIDVLQDVSAEIKLRQHGQEP